MTKAPLSTAHVSDGSTMTVSPPDNKDDGFITLRGPTTPLASAVPQPIAMSAVPMSNQFNKLVSDDKGSPPAESSATMPMRTFQDDQHAAEESFDSILDKICQSKVDHQRWLCQSFRIYTSDKTKQRQDFEYQQSSFLDGIKAKLRAVEQALNSTVASVTINFTMIGATLTKVEADTTRMSVLLEENRP
jgi:hypothetical protein